MPFERIEQGICRRYPVEGGYLYQLAEGTGWTDPVFVPDMGKALEDAHVFALRTLGELGATAAEEKVYQLN